MSTRWARFARGWLVAVFSTLIAAASHTIAGGPPSTLAIVLSLAFAGMLCVGLAGKRLSRMRLAASVVGSQLLFHQLFASLGNSVWTPAAHVHPGMEPALNVTAMSGSWQPASTSDALWMLAAHAVAAAATFLLLRLAEQAFWGLPSSGLIGSARALLRILFRQGLQPVLFDAPRAPSAPRHPRVFSSVALRSALRYRGPPAALAPTFA
jgi:hypothetical protein